MRPSVRNGRDLLEDYASEVAELHGLAPEESGRRFMRFMDVYHYRREAGTEEEWAAIHGGEVEHSFIRVSKPFRFRNQEVVPRVLAALAEHLPSTDAPPRVLDYGGGFGNDSIVFARSGFEAHYSDLLTLKNADIVRKRFELRGLDIPMHDAFGLPHIRFDAISALDVLEHIYDVEEATAQLTARVKRGGLLCCANAFGAITFDGDHHDKNRVYVPLFRALMDAVGFKLVTDDPPLEVFRRDAEPLDDIGQDVARLRRVLYETTRDHCIARSTELLDVVSEGKPDLRGLAASADTGVEMSPARRRIMEVGTRMAPDALKRWVRERNGRAQMSAIEQPASATDALGLLADHVAVLRIAQSRLAGLPPSG
ncbi:MAG: hypothetical protein QOH13_2258 [Thermoleophilaceae bacterium]|nr:hypothetical protein [Thermoleophilaceae bacterium]